MLKETPEHRREKRHRRRDEVIRSSFDADVANFLVDCSMEPEVMDDRLDATRIGFAMSILPDREFYVFYRYVILEDILVDIGEPIGLSKERIRQIIRKAREHIRDWEERYHNPVCSDWLQQCVLRFNGLGGAAASWKAAIPQVEKEAARAKRVEQIRVRTEREKRWKEEREEMDRVRQERKVQVEEAFRVEWASRIQFVTENATWLGSHVWALEELASCVSPLRTVGEGRVTWTLMLWAETCIEGLVGIAWKGLDSWSRVSPFCGPGFYVKLGQEGAVIRVPDSPYCLALVGSLSHLSMRSEDLELIRQCIRDQGWHPLPDDPSLTTVVQQAT